MLPGIRIWALGILAVGVFGFMLLPSGATAEPACPSELNDAVTIAFPGQVAFGNEVPGDIRIREKVNGWKFSGPIRTRFSNAAGWTGPLETRPGIFIKSDFSLKTFRNTRRWAFKVFADYRNTTTDQICTRTAVKRIKARPGYRAGFKARAPVSYLNNGISLEIACPRVHWFLSNPHPMVLAITEGSRTRKIWIRGACVDDNPMINPLFQGGKHWSAETSEYFQHVELSLTKKSRKPFRIRIRARQDSKVVFKRTVTARWIRRPGRRIWMGSDAFINYCINELRPLRSSGGRLYCSTPDRSFYRTRYQRR